MSKTWHFVLQDRVDNDPLTDLEMICKSGFTHVLLYVSNRWTGKLLQHEGYRSALKAAVAMCKRYGAKTVLIRNPFTTKSEQPDTTAGQLFQVDYWVNEINLLREEQKEFRCNYCGFDVEIHERNTSPYTKLLYLGPGEQIKVLETIYEVLRCVEKVDIILPCGSARENCLYNFLRELGRVWIAEWTYYNDYQHKAVHQPYNVFGINMGLEEGGRKYTIKSMVENQARFAGKDIMIYTSKAVRDEVAKQLYDYSQLFRCKDRG